MYRKRDERVKEMSWYEFRDSLFKICLSFFIRVSYRFPSSFVYFVRLGRWSLVWFSGEDEEGPLISRVQKVYKKNKNNES